MHSKPILAFLGIIVLIFASGVIGFMGKMIMTIENRKVAENKIAQLEKEKERLSSEVSKLKTQDGIEESIREKFGLVKEGEGMIMIVDDKNQGKKADSPKEGFLSSLFFWKSWFK